MPEPRRCLSSGEKSPSRSRSVPLLVIALSESVCHLSRPCATDRFLASSSRKHEPTHPRLVDNDGGEKEDVTELCGGFFERQCLQPLEQCIKGYLPNYSYKLCKTIIYYIMTSVSQHHWKHSVALSNPGELPLQVYTL